MALSPFKMGFDINNYSAILPPKPNDSEILNIEKDLEDQYWQKLAFPSKINKEFLFQENDRLRNGVWVMIKGVPVWIPPNYYFFLQYGNVNGSAPAFRLKRLMNKYFKIQVRHNMKMIGTFVIKNRKDGETTDEMHDVLWEVGFGELDNGEAGIQSKTGADSKSPCWSTLTSAWNGLPQFFKKAFFPHFDSGDSIKEKMEFIRKPDPNNPNDLGQTVLLAYYNSVHNAMDGRHNVRLCILDEVCKWVQAPLTITLINYKKFIKPGFSRKGMFRLLSSPADTNGDHNNEAYELWKQSDLKGNNPMLYTPDSEIAGYYSCPLHGIEGAYDKYGDADPERIYEEIQRVRRSTPKEHLMSEIRGFPLPKKGTFEPDEEELFGATDSSNLWSNHKGIVAHHIYVKDNFLSLGQYGNLEYETGVRSPNVVWRPSDRTTFDPIEARWWACNINFQKPDIADIYTPPTYIEAVTGVDPFNLRHQAKDKSRGSYHAMVTWFFRDLFEQGILNTPLLIYLARPQHQHTSFEDTFKTALFTRSLIQYENTSDKLENYFDDEGLINWLLPSKNKQINIVNGVAKIRRGDSPAGKGGAIFMNEIVSMIDINTNIPRTPLEPYILQNFKNKELLEDLINFDVKDTVKNHLTMAFGQSLFGTTKLLFNKPKQDELNDTIIRGLI